MEKMTNLKTEELRNRFEEVREIADLVKLETEAYTHLQDFFADEDEDFEEAQTLWKNIVTARKMYFRITDKRQGI